MEEILALLPEISSLSPLNPPTSSCHSLTSVERESTQVKCRFKHKRLAKWKELVSRLEGNVMLRMTKIKHDWRQNWTNCRKNFQRERERMKYCFLMKLLSQEELREKQIMTQPDQ